MVTFSKVRHFGTEMHYLFLDNLVLRFSKLVKICNSCCYKFKAKFLMGHYVC